MCHAHTSSEGGVAVFLVKKKAHTTSSICILNKAWPLFFYMFYLILLPAAASLSAQTGIGGIFFRWGPQWGLGMGVYVGPCFQGREPSRGSAFLTQSTTKGMWTIWTKPMSHNGPTQARPCGPMASQRSHTDDFFHSPWRWRHGLRYSSAPPSLPLCVCVCAPYFLPSCLAQGEQGHLWGPLRCPHDCVDVKNAAAGQHITGWRVNEPIVSFIHLFYQRFKSSYDSGSGKKYQQMNEWMHKWQMKCLLIVSSYYKTLIWANSFSL